MIGNRRTKSVFNFSTEGVMTEIQCRINVKTDHIEFPVSITRVGNRVDGRGCENNKSCAMYLGVHVAERVLSHIYPNVERMVVNYPGYDFICGKGYKVDVKSGCSLKRSPNTWAFYPSKNKTADYFLCLAFDNRDDLNPQHIWLIPGHIINDRMGVSISKSTISKWSEYEQPINEVISCCNVLKGELI